MLSLGQSCGVRFCSEEIEPAINLKCVRAHDFCPYFTSDICCQFGFPRRSGSDDKKRAPHSIKIEFTYLASLQKQIPQIAVFAFALS